MVSALAHVITADADAWSQEGPQRTLDDSHVRVVMERALASRLTVRTTYACPSQQRVLNMRSAPPAGLYGEHQGDLGLTWAKWKRRLEKAGEKAESTNLHVRGIGRLRPSIAPSRAAELVTGYTDIRQHMTMVMMHDERGRGRILERGAVILAVGGSGSLLNVVDARRSTRAPHSVCTVVAIPTSRAPNDIGPSPSAWSSVRRPVDRERRDKKKRAYTQAGHSYHIRHRGTSKKGLMRHACRVEYRMCELGTDRARSTETSTRARSTANRAVTDLRAPG